LLLFFCTYDAWRLFCIPFSRWKEARDQTALLSFWPDRQQTAPVALELNGLRAIYHRSGHEDAIPRSEMTVALSEDEQVMALLLEGPPERMAIQYYRFPDPILMENPELLCPETVPGIKMRYRRQAQLLEIRVATMPPLEAACPINQARKVFPGKACDETLSRILLKMDVQQ
jgi:hypothetical protein